jgi:hypothetical protein
LKYAVSVDSLVSSGRFPAPQHVKIDTDGNDLQILRGMAQLLASPQKPKSIQVEVDDDRMGELVAFMHGKNYELSRRHYTRHGLDLIEQGLEPKYYNATFHLRT